ncbi:SNF2 family N-terminal domain-containing protein [Lentinula detonsa]|uniref:DNA helicase n=1 Tax=Lentinula detonsa TaxID=2804962 RepID=A0A9W8P7Y8_9AGAR|nr:SNF2 family N-terminal domain-containing protein [Lentinula detonsa]
MSTTAEQAAKRASTLDRIRLERQQGKLLGTSIPSSSSSSSSSYPAPPAQSRDATFSSRFFPPTPGSSNDTVLVPSSSPLHSPVNGNTRQPYTQPRWPDVAFRNGGAHAGSWNSAQLAPGYDPLTVSSGFTSQSNAQKASNLRQFSPGGSDDGRPKKRPNLSDISPTLALAQSPDSPGIQRPGQRRRMLVDAGSTSSEESTPESSSRTRLVRGRPADSAEPPLPSAPADPFSDPKFIRFNMTMPGVPSNRVKAAWLQAKQDVRLATKLASDDSWVPNPTPHSSPLSSKAPTEIHGKVDGLEAAHKAKLAAMKEKSKKSSIYAKRPNAPKIAPPATPVVKHPIDLIIESPAVSQPIRRKRNKNMIVDSDSEAEMNVSEDERSHKRSRQESNHELRVLNFFNTQSSEALLELTGCTEVQAQTIIDLRKFTSVDDMNTKLGQGKKKAGPAGLSPRLIDDAVEIFKGYTAVDEILEECEEIGAKLRASIASWSSISSKGKGKQLDTLPESVEDGALNLRTMSSPTEHKPKGYIDKQPASLSDSVKLKDYQLLGLNWLQLLYRSNLSCILADEMGLGKTVQVISFLALLRERGNKGPHLIVVPSSTLENWCREFARFASSISVQVYYGGKNERVELRQTLLDAKRCDKGNEDDGWDVLITTYNLAQGESDRKFFRRIEWDCCVFDEGHVLKNFQSQRYSSLLRIQSRWRLLLTGTPLQNNLQELVSLMNFILPEQFGDSLDDLRQVFKVKGDSKASLLAQERVSRAKKMMTPFVLRRRKDQAGTRVLQDLPKKTERIEWCEITPLQKSIYRDTLQRSRKTVLESETPVDSAATSDTNGRGKAPKKTRPPAKAKEKQYLENSANVLMDLRKAALHPMLFRSRFTDDTLSSIAKQLLKEPDFKKRGALFEIVKEDMSVMTDAELQHFCGMYKSIRKYEQPSDCFLDSGKIQMLLTLLTEYQKEDRKILIFSQFTQILDILEVILKKKDIHYLVLTGSTPVDVRQSLVDEFSEDPSIPIFLLSTKAGGMGINLTAASVVIMFDQDFNPHNDRQAQDRAYRIGQKRDVEVVKLISRGTIEEDMLRLSEMKLALDEAVAGDDDKGESAPEREMKASLMSTLRRQFEKQQVSDTENTGS